MGMLIGIFALFSGVTERQCKLLASDFMNDTLISACYVWGLVLAFVDAALSSGMLAFVLYIVRIFKFIETHTNLCLAHQ